MNSLWVADNSVFIKILHLISYSLKQQHITMNFNNDTAKQILIDIIRTVNQSDNSKKLSEAKASAGKEMLLMMQHVFPLVMQLQTEVIKSYGFPGNREGLVQFSQLIRELEREDVEIARLRSQIRAIYLPPIAINTTNDILI